jgi:lysophospholipase L1-like esterase
MNGLTHLKPTLSSHRPIDVLVIMLGTNDLKMRFNVPPFDVASGLLALSETALAWGAGPHMGKPKLVIVSPVPVIESAWLGQMFTGGAAKALRLPELYRGVAERLGATFFDAATVAEISPVDGVHFDAEQHRRIGEAMAEVVSAL